jgi:hypothetical protein|tara:strand:- start:411 stop:647 length:237 start_codon:yes stop_codon:yes gene_type:complete
MSASSINRQVAEIEKAKKVERRKALAGENVYSAGRVVSAPVVEEKPVEPTIVSVVDSGEIKAKPAFVKKPASKKKSKK